MVDEQDTTTENSAEQTPKPQKKIGLLAGIFLIGFIFTSAVNYFQIKATFVPPEPTEKAAPKEKPVTSVDLRAEAGDSTAVAVAETLRVESRVDSARADSLGLALKQQQAETQAKDSLLQATRAELEQAKVEPPKEQETKIDSADLKRSAKLAKIVENMAPTDAAKMLEPLNDEMIIYILLRLKQRQAAQVMAALPASRAANLSRAIMEPVMQKQ